MQTQISQNSLFLRNSVYRDSVLVVHRGVFLGKTPPHTLQHTSNGTLGLVIGSREPLYPHKRGIPSSCIFEKFLRKCYFWETDPKNSSRDFRHSTVFLVACQSAPSMVLGGQKQRTMLHSVALHMDFLYFWEILLFLRNSLLPRYNTTLNNRATPPGSIFTEAVGYTN